MKCFFRAMHGAERVVGPRIVPAFALPFASAESFRRREDFAQFQRLRAALPAEFWKDLSARQHHRRMIRHWQYTGGAILHYHRLGLPQWKRRFHMSGIPPWDLPEWKTRPVVLAFLHTGAFPLLAFWLRSRGIPAAFVLGGLPFILSNDPFRNMLRAGDHRYKLQGVPVTFPRRGPGVREAFRFLKPGRILTMALDGGRISTEFDTYDAGGFPFYAKQGAFRLAARTNAVLMPVSIACTDRMHFHVRFGRPVSEKIMRRGNCAAATQHLITELWSDLRQHPEELSYTALEGVSPHLKTHRAGWL